jgi:two-component system response regulator EvgA
MLASQAPCDYPIVMSILIVDDHPSFRAAARAVLESDGFAVVGEAQDGASALEAVRLLHPDVVLLDVQLPDTDGFCVAAELTHDAGGPQVVLTSSRDAADFGPLVAQCGACGFIPKAELCADRLAALLQ